MKKRITSSQLIPSDHEIERTTDEKKIEDKHEDKHEEILHSNDQYLLNSLLDNLPEHIYFKDIESRFIKISASLAQQFGLNDPSEAIGKTDFDYFSKEHAESAYKDEKEIIRTGNPISIEEKETWTDHPDTWVLTTKMPLYGRDGKIIGTFGISKDITARKIADDKLRIQADSLQEQIREINILHDQLRDQATRDSLTGLSNRRLMNKVLTQQLEECKQFKQTLNIIIIDIDNFKDINDTFGHQAGDALLEKFGEYILSSTRADDFSGRLGGDEIILVFQKMPLEATIKKAETLRKKLKAISVLSEGQRISRTVSIGIAAYPVHGDNIDDLISRADEALYCAKEKGKDQVVLARK